MVDAEFLDIVSVVPSTTYDPSSKKMVNVSGSIRPVDSDSILVEPQQPVQDIILNFKEDTSGVEFRVRQLDGEFSTWEMLDLNRGEGVDVQGFVPAGANSVMNNPTGTLGLEWEVRRESSGQSVTDEKFGEYEWVEYQSYTASAEDGTTWTGVIRYKRENSQSWIIETTQTDNPRFINKAGNDSLDEALVKYFENMVRELDLKVSELNASIQKAREKEEAVERVKAGEAAALAERELIKTLPNLDDSIKSQVEAYMAGTASCFDLVQGFGWQYVAGGKVMVLDDDDGLLGNQSSSGVLVLRITKGYRLEMIIGVDSGVLNIGDSGTRDVFDDNYVQTGNPGLGAFVDSRISNEFAVVPMKGGDSIQIDIDGNDGGVGDFRVTATPKQDGRSYEITQSVAVNNDVQLAIDSGSVRLSPERYTTEDDLERRNPPTDEDLERKRQEKEDDEDEPRSRSEPRGTSPLTLGLIMVALAGVALYVFASPSQAQDGVMRL